MSRAIRIVGWADHFETSESRKRKGGLDWVALPTRMDGKRFRLLARHERAAELFAAWTLILEIAARCPERGTLIDDRGEPILAEDLAVMTGFDESIFELAFEVLADDHGKIRWLQWFSPATDESDDAPEPATGPAEAPADLLEPAAPCCDLPASAESSAGPGKKQSYIDIDKDSNRDKDKNTLRAQAEAIYEIYPRKQGKADALKAIDKQLRHLRSEGDPNAAATLTEAVTAYARSPAGQKPPDGSKDYRPHPATWFNAQRYLDDRETWITPNGDRHAPSSSSRRHDPDANRGSYADPTENPLLARSG